MQILMIGVVMLIVALLLTVFLAVTLGISVVMWREIGRPTWELVWKEVRKRRFSLGAIFSGVATCAVTFALVRIASPESEIGWLLSAVIAMVLAIGVVAFVAIVRNDFAELYARRYHNEEDVWSKSPERTTDGEPKDSDFHAIRFPLDEDNVMPHAETK